MTKSIGPRLSLSLLAFALAGCATVGTTFSSVNVANLRVGNTTEADVERLFGKPPERKTRSEGNRDALIYVYSYAEGTRNTGKSRRLALEFVDGVLNAYVFHSALGQDLTDFDIDARTALVAGSSQRSDVIRLFGAPHGEVALPSGLLLHEFGALPEVAQPDDATQALVYNYLEVKREEGRLRVHLKLLLAFLSSNNVVVQVRHFAGIL